MYSSISCLCLTINSLLPLLLTPSTLYYTQLYSLQLTHPSLHRLYPSFASLNPIPFLLSLLFILHLSPSISPLPAHSSPRSRLGLHSSALILWCICVPNHSFAFYNLRRLAFSFPVSVTLVPSSAPTRAAKYSILDNLQEPV